MLEVAGGRYFGGDITGENHGGGSGAAFDAIVKLNKGEKYECKVGAKR